MNEGKKVKPPVKCAYCGKDYSGIDGLAYPSDEGNPKGNIYFKLEKCYFCKVPTVFQYYLSTRYDYGMPSSREHRLNYYYPAKANINLPLEIQETFPRMFEVYRQAMEAKAQGYDELVGLGLRKALEILVTDYLIQIQNQDDSIKDLSLHKRIEKLDATVFAKPCAMLAKIIGNDETHYDKFHGFDVGDMQLNIETLCIFMASKIQVDKAAEVLDSIKSTS